MKKKIRDLFPYLGLETVEPWDIDACQEFFQQLGGKVPADVATFYSLTDGGEIPSIECRFYGLEDAVEIAEQVRELQTAMPVLPVFEGSGEASDPICVLLDKGLAGTVVQFCHDGGSRVHAISFIDFLKALTETEEGPLAPSSHDFCFPKKLNKKENTIAQRLIDKSNEPVDPDSVCENAEYEPELMAELAQSMVPAKSVHKLVNPLELTNGDARSKAAVKLYYAGTSESKAMLETYCRTMNEFANELKQALAAERTKVTLAPVVSIAPTTWIKYRGRQVLVDNVYSTATGKKRWDEIRKWIKTMDELLDD